MAISYWKLSSKAYSAFLSFAVGLAITKLISGNESYTVILIIRVQWKYGAWGHMPMLLNCVQFRSIGVPPYIIILPFFV